MCQQRMIKRVFQRCRWLLVMGLFMGFWMPLNSHACIFTNIVCNSPCTQDAGGCTCPADTPVSFIAYLSTACGIDDTVWRVTNQQTGITDEDSYSGWEPQYTTTFATQDPYQVKAIVYPAGSPASSKFVNVTVSSNTYTITVIPSAGGTVKGFAGVEGDAIDCAGTTAPNSPLCQETYLNERGVTMKAELEPGWLLLGWDVNGQMIETESHIIQVSGDADIQLVTAKEVDIAFTFDDGPHVSLSGRTVSIINTLLKRQQILKKPVKVTFFVEHSRIVSGQGKKILKDYMRKHKHEVGLHGAHETEHHRKHQDTGNLQTRMIAMKAIIASEDAGGKSPTHTRPPGGWGGWTQGDVYTKEQVAQIYKNISLIRYVGEGTGGVNSWGEVYPSHCPHDKSECWPTSEERVAFIDSIKAKIDEAKTSSTPPKLVILMHDVRAPDKDDIGNILDEIETYANTQSVRINYKTLEELY